MAKIKRQQFTFKEQRRLVDSYIMALNAKQRKHYETNLHEFPREKDIKMLLELSEMLKNLEYVGTWDGVAPAIQTNMFA
ncbi:hypothetical protein [Spirosoma litoris]